MLSEKERKLLAETWDTLTPVAEYIGSDALLRMFTNFPGSKTYFSHLNISAGSPHLFSHGKKIVLAIAEGARDISQLTITLAPLQTYHAYVLRIDPSNFKVLEQDGFIPNFSLGDKKRGLMAAAPELFSHCMLISLACHMGEDFTPVLHAAMDKYLSAFAAVLAEKYR